MRVAAYVARAAGAALAPFTIDRRDPGPRDVAIDALFCGVCHSDIHQARDEWGGRDLPDGAGARDRRSGDSGGPE